MIRRKPKYPTRQQLAERRAWSEQFDRCWVCGCDSGWHGSLNLHVELHTHELARRSQAAYKWADVRNYLCTCARCHEEILSWLDLDLQLGLKAIYDPDNYDRQFINQIRGEAPNSVEEYEVALAKKFWRVVHER